MVISSALPLSLLLPSRATFASLSISFYQLTMQDAGCSFILYNGPNLIHSILIIYCFIPPSLLLFSNSQILGSQNKFKCGIIVNCLPSRFPDCEKIPSFLYLLFEKTDGKIRIEIGSGGWICEKLETVLILNVRDNGFGFGLDVLKPNANRANPIHSSFAFSMGRELGLPHSSHQFSWIFLCVFGHRKRVDTAACIPTPHLIVLLLYCCGLHTLSLPFALLLQCANGFYFSFPTPI
jgi:hypothetical protein